MLRMLTFVTLISLIGCVEASGAQLTVSGTEFVPDTTLILTVAFSDGTTTTAVTRVPVTSARRHASKRLVANLTLDKHMLSHEVHFQSAYLNREAYETK
jgi:hypothetical protein